MPPGTRIGTASLRREAQLRERHPHLRITPVRGNLDTRLAKLDRGEYDALVLAAAGLKRLGLESRIRCTLDTDVSLPAPGQGALAIACDKGTQPIIELGGELVARLGNGRLCLRFEPGPLFRREFDGGGNFLAQLGQVRLCEVRAGFPGLVYESGECLLDIGGELHLLGPGVLRGRGHRKRERQGREP